MAGAVDEGVESTEEDVEVESVLADGAPSMADWEFLLQPVTANRHAGMIVQANSLFIITDLSLGATPFFRNTRF